MAFRRRRGSFRSRSARRGGFRRGRRMRSARRGPLRIGYRM